MAGENTSNRLGLRTEEAVIREEVVDFEVEIERISH